MVILSEEGIPLRHKTIQYVLGRHKKNDPPVPTVEKIKRVIAIANEIVGDMKTFRVKHVALEGYAMNAKWQGHQLGELAGVVKTQLYLSCGIVPEPIPPAAARKHILGYGNPDKKQIEDVVRIGLGCDVQSDHEADAMIIARYMFDRVVAEEKQLL